MYLDSKKLVSEIQELTTVDGFIGACLEIKESMFFYERKLMLAAYNASLELLIVVALIYEVLQNAEAEKKVAEEVIEALEQLLNELDEYHFPIDIQYVVDHYSRDYGAKLSWRIPVYIEMVKKYATSQEQEEADLGSLLVKAHRQLEVENDPEEIQLNSFLAQIGVQMLRGSNLRPLWIELSHPRIQAVLLGLQTLVSNFRVTPYFNYPLEGIEIERQKRKKIKGNVVTELGAFRNFRQGESGYTELNISQVQDEYDFFLAQITSDSNYLKLEPDKTMIDLILQILELDLVSNALEASLLSRLLAYCELWELTQTSDLLLETLTRLDPEEPLFYAYWSVIRSFQSKAIPAMRRLARADRESPFLPYLALFLAHGEPGKRKWSLLQEILEEYPKEDEIKAQIAISLGRYRGEEVANYLEELLTNEPLSPIYREGLLTALKRAQA